MDKSDVVLARLEQQMVNLNHNFLAFIKSQDVKNDAFFEVRDDVIALKAKANFGWKLILVFGSITVSVASAVAWLVTHLKLKMMGM